MNKAVDSEPLDDDGASRRGRKRGIQSALDVSVERLNARSSDDAPSGGPSVRRRRGLGTTLTGGSTEPASNITTRASDVDVVSNGVPGTLHIDTLMVTCGCEACQLSGEPLTKAGDAH
jgi:hypothetical protein